MAYWNNAGRVRDITPNSQLNVFSREIIFRTTRWSENGVAIDYIYALIPSMCRLRDVSWYLDAPLALFFRYIHLEQ